jgi:hypothetical protein
VIRTVLTFESLGNQTTLKLDLAPGVFDGLGRMDLVDLAALPEGTLAERGAALLTLLQNHQTVRDGLATVLAAPPGSAPSPLYFHVRTSTADLIAWEQLYEAQRGFFALDRRWPVGRIAQQKKQLEPRAFTPPLRIVAVLAAAGRDGGPQLRALLEACETAGAAAVEVALHVISGDPDVLEQARLGGASTQEIAPTPPGLARQVTEAKPHLLHVLCHGGGAAAGVRRLAFAHGADVDAAAFGGADGLGSIRMSVAELVGALLPCNPWLVVLSACQSAQAGVADGGTGVAHEMASSGIPAVVGMRRLVDLTETNRFCAALYPEVLALIGQALAPGGPAGQPQVRSIDWAEAMTAPRVVLSGIDPVAADSWTDPVLYVQDAQLQVFQPAPQLSSADFQHLRGKIDEFQARIATLDPATTPPQLMAELQARVAELEAELAQAGGR